MATNKDIGIAPAGQEARPPQPQEHPQDRASKPKRKESEWFDVMIVGYTGRGKSTTADKLILAYHKSKPCPAPFEGKEQEVKTDAEAKVEAHEDRVTRIDEVERENNEGAVMSPPEEDPDEVRSKKQVEDKRQAVKHKNVISVDDLFFWTVDSIDDVMEVPIIGYLKQLELSREMECPHLDINAYRKNKAVNSLTKSCQLISNNSTKIRVLDVPGFFTMQPNSNALKPSNFYLEEESESCTQRHLALMRNIIRIQYAVKMKLNRILYFLPERGPLERPSEVLKQELLTLARYFGKSLFDSMVIVATAPARYSEMPDMKGRHFSKEDIAITKEQFRKVLKEVLRPCSKDVLPDPPFIDISLLDECEEIVEKIKATQVAKSTLELSFDPGVCIKCSCTIKEIEGERILCIPKGSSKSSFIAYKDSTCHPLFIPKHSELDDITNANGVKTMVLKRCPGEAGDSTEEVCHSCRMPPGHPGCMRVGTKYEINIKDKKERILVDHTNIIEKHRTLNQTGSDDESTDEDEDDLGLREGASYLRGGGTSCVSEAIEDKDPTSLIVVPEGTQRMSHKGRRGSASEQKHESLLDEAGLANFN